MKWDKRTRIVIFFGVTLTACALSMHALVARLSAVNRCVVIVDNRLSSDVAAHIVDTIEQQICAGKSYTTIATAITQKFPCIDDIALHRCAPGVLHCDVTSINPLIQINDMYVVSNDGALIVANNFSPALLRTLHTMRVENSDKTVRMSNTFITTVQKLIPSLLDAYDARWIDENELVLQEKQTSNFSIICNAQKLPDARLLAYYQQLKNDVCSKNAAKMQQWAVDVRFEHQIVVSPCKPAELKIVSFSSPGPDRRSRNACQGGVAHG